MRKVKANRAKRRPISEELLFLLGTVIITLHALDLLDRFGLKPAPFLSRHVHGDPGDLPDDAFRANRLAIENGGRIMSAYNIGPSQFDRFWIVTDEGRSVTTIILPGEG